MISRPIPRIIYNLRFNDIINVFNRLLVRNVFVVKVSMVILIVLLIFMMELLMGTGKMIQHRIFEEHICEDIDRKFLHDITEVHKILARTPGSLKAREKSIVILRTFLIMLIWNYLTLIIIRRLFQKHQSSYEREADIFCLKFFYICHIK